MEIGTAGAWWPGLWVLRVFVPNPHYTCSSSPLPPEVAAAQSLGNPRWAGPGVQGKGWDPPCSCGGGYPRWPSHPLTGILTLNLFYYKVVRVSS